MRKASLLFIFCTATIDMKPVVAGNGTVTGFTAKGANNARDGQNHTFTLYVLCYTG